MRLQGRKLRHKRIRKRIIGTKEKPRLCVFRSNKHIGAQLIDDIEGKTIFALTTNSSKFKEKLKNAGNIKTTELFGAEFAKACVGKGVSYVVFDRAGYQYHGRVKALAESCRKNGLKF